MAQTFTHVFVYFQYIVIKFLGPRGEQVGRIGVLGVHFFGYEISRSCPLSQDLGMEQIAPVPESNPVQGATLFLRILAFLDDMAKDQCMPAKLLFPVYLEVLSINEGQLDLSTTSLELIWDVYTLVTSRGRNRKTIAAGVLLLRLLYQSLPYLKASKLLYGKEYKQDTDKMQQLSQQVFAHLCEIVDNEKDEYGSETKQISQHIILEGSLAVKMQVGYSGCQPACLSSVIGVMTTLLSVAQQEVNSSLAACKNSTANHGQSKPTLPYCDSLSSSNLVQLLCAMQKNLIIWCHNQLKTAGPRGKEAILSLIQCYTDILSVKVCSTLQIIHALGDKKMAAIDRLEQSFIASATRQLVLFLSLFVNEENICMPILRSLQPIALELRRFSTELPDLFFKKMAAIDRLEQSFIASATRQLVLFLSLFVNEENICMPILRSLQPIALELRRFSTELPDLFFKVFLFPPIPVLLFKVFLFPPIPELLFKVFLFPPIPELLFKVFLFPYTYILYTYTCIAFQGILIPTYT
ncbi:predicted protein [Nematostella vectensis]|uniref:Uncharacterized protein n=1 Tax=Nematostella vectensis TaxID=45351 RepID=A7T5R5_NEMVE|nr:predicted protein [Nematostella vectensis]|eukprot:XP_001620796.1 hypothetical protein NEMVEDRAFT_v1g222695 [Nematostella vectensis]